MSRIYTMARFDETTIDTIVVGYCELCGEELCAGEDVLKWDGCLFCCTYCLLDSLDYETITLEDN